MSHLEQYDFDILTNPPPPMVPSNELSTLLKVIHRFIICEFCIHQQISAFCKRGIVNDVPKIKKHGHFY